MSDPTLFYGLMPQEFTSRRLIGRSAWNTQWKIVIPAYTLLNNEQEALNRFAAAAVALLAAGYYFFLPAPTPEAAPIITTAPSPPEEKVTLRTYDDPQEVFQRAFWRRPTAEDRILHAERREWVSEEDGVRRWQWFLAVEPSAALAQWLRDDNAFGLARVTSAAPSDGFGQLPSWFPTRGELPRCEIHQAVGNKMTLIFDPAKEVLYATGAGHGFAAAHADASLPRKPRAALP